MKFLILMPLLLACSSGPVQLSDDAKEIEVVSSKPAGCSVVGKFTGLDKMGSKELALNDALNQAAKAGATAVLVNQEVPNGSKMAVHATGYRCD